MQDAGVEVTVGLLEQEVRWQNRRFFCQQEKHRPYLILKWAQTADGFVARENFDSKWISNEKSRTRVHQWRAEEQAIMVGANTVTQDNPRLTTREVEGTNPIRIVVDIKNSLSRSSQVFNSEATTIKLTKTEIDPKKPLASQISKALYINKITSVIIEGGLKTLQAFINEDLWDEARIIKGIPFFKEGTKAPFINGKICSESKIKQDTLKIVLND